MTVSKNTPENIADLFERQRGRLDTQVRRVAKKLGVAEHAVKKGRWKSIEAVQSLADERGVSKRYLATKMSRWKVIQRPTSANERKSY